MSDEVDRISETFKNKTVFVSGATGFLGKLLVEKILRTADVKRIYMLVRSKKGKTPFQRLNDLFDHVVFNRLKQEKPDFAKKCQIITGDLEKENLGITDADRNDLRNEVNFIFHSAASTRFDDSMKDAVITNTRSTKYMLDLARECKYLDVFMHVSTAYAFPNEDVLYEKAYAAPADPVEILNAIKIMDDTALQQYSKRAMHNCPNTYTFSKALAEELVIKEVGRLPVVIVRPAIVVPTLEEPLPGFFNNLQSPIGIFIGAGKGVVRSVYMDSKSYANLIPADGTINMFLVAAWHYINAKSDYIFNICVPTEDMKMNWEELIEVGKEVANTRTPFNRIVWYPSGIMTKSKIWHYFNVFLFQLIPAVIIDTLLFCMGYPPVLVKVNKRLLKGQDMFEYYTTKAWNFSTTGILKLRRKLNSKEKKTYKIDAEGFVLADYLENCALYARRNLFHETDDMLPAAKRNVKIFFIVDRIIKISFFGLLFYYLYNLIFGRKV